MTPITRMTHLNSLSKVVNYLEGLFFRYGTNLLIDSHSEFSNELWIVLILVVFKEPPGIKKKSGVFRSGKCGNPLGFTAPADQPIRESMV